MTANFSQLDTKYVVRFQKAFVLERPVKMSPALGVRKRLRNLCAVALLSVVVFAPTALLAQSSSISLVSSNLTSTYGAPVTFTATVPNGATGTVTFTNNGTTIGVVPISGTTATLTTSSSLLLDVGNDVIVAIWSGDPSSPAYLTQTINRATPSIAWNPVGSTTINGSVNKITTVAGSSNMGGVGDDGPATNAYLFPYGVAVDRQGNIFIADTNNERIRKVTISTGIITTIVGYGGYGSSGDGGPADWATLSAPRGVAVDDAGNLYIADTYGYRIRKIDVATGIITTIAGTGTPATSYTDGSVAASTAIGFITYLAVDAQRNVYISDFYRIRKITASTGTIATVAGNIMGVTGDGGLATNASINPGSIAFDSTGNLYFASGYSIRRVDASTGIITTVAGNGLPSYSGDGDLATNTSIGPTGIAFDSSDNLYIAEGSNYRIRKVDASTGIISTIAGNGVWGHSGDDGFAPNASIMSSTGVAVDPTGNIYFVENRSYGSIRKIFSSNQNIAAISYGTPLGAAQLNASANVPGAFSYTPPTGIVLPVGVQTLSTTFTPTDTTNWSAVTVSAPLDVTQVASSLSISSSNPTANHGDWLTFTATISSGATGSVTFYDGSTVIGSAQINGTTAILVINSLDIGTHNITASWSGNANYAASSASPITQIVQNPQPVITWPISASIPAGTALSASQLNATANMPGTFVYSPSVGEVLSSGLHTLSVTFTPTDVANYPPVTATVPLVVSAPIPTTMCR